MSLMFASLIGTSDAPVPPPSPEEMCTSYVLTCREDWAEAMGGAPFMHALLIIAADPDDPNNIIDWGDGTTDTYHHDTGDISEEGMNIHEYAEPGEYTVRILGNHLAAAAATFFVSGVNWTTKILSISPTVIGCDLMFAGARYLAEIDGSIKIPTGVESVNDMFHSVGGGELPDGSQIHTTISKDFTLPETVKDCRNMFMESYLAGEWGPGLLPKNVENVSSMFDACVASTLQISENTRLPNSIEDATCMCYDCTICADISHLFDDWISGSKKVDSMFQASEVTGTVPADKLWNNTGVTWAGTTGCFCACYNLNNYDEIPTDWKSDW